MGYHGVKAEIHATLSAHNSDRDAEHDELWANARARIAAVVADPKYQPILLDATGLDTDGRW